MDQDLLDTRLVAQKSRRKIRLGNSIKLNVLIAYIDPGYGDDFVQKGGKLKMGPVWDFDIAFGNENYAGNSGVEGRWLHQVQWFARMKQDPWFRALLQQRFDYLYAHRRELLDFIKESSLRLSPSASLNDERWDLFSRQVLYNPVALGSYDAEVQRLESWLDSRLNWMALNDWL